MSEKTKNPDCKCHSVDCSRHGDCEKCMAYHKSNGSKTSCGK